MKNWENTIWVELSSINDGKRIYVLFDDEWCWKMTETEARNSYSIITFLEVFLSFESLKLWVRACVLWLFYATGSY
jgi:hypothetical protein